MEKNILNELFNQVVLSTNTYFNKISKKEFTSPIRFSYEHEGNLNIINNIEGSFFVIKNNLQIQDQNITYNMIFPRSLIEFLLKNLTDEETSSSNPFDTEEDSGFENLLGVEESNEDVNVQPVEFSNLTPSVDKKEENNIDLLLDVPMQISVELGRSTSSIKDILSLGEVAVIELDKLAGEPVDILINRKPFAKGEVVVIDESFGVRITEIISLQDRFSMMK